MSELQTTSEGPDGHRYVLRRNQPLVADRTRMAWQVTRGVIEVFGTRFENDNPSGHRRHLFRVPAGRTLFGLQPVSEDGSFGILTVAGEETEVIRIDTGSLSREQGDDMQLSIITWAEQIGQYPVSYTHHRAN